MKALFGACLLILLLTYANAQTLMPEQTRYVAPDDTRKFDSTEYTAQASFEDRIKLAETWPKINGTSFDRQKNFTIQAGTGITLEKLINGLALSCNPADLNVSDMNWNNFNSVFLKLNQSTPQTVSGGIPTFSGIYSDGNISPAGEDPWTLGTSSNRWTNLYSTNTDASNKTFLGIQTILTRDHNIDLQSYTLTYDLSNIGSRIKFMNVNYIPTILTFSAETTEKTINFPNTNGNVYVSSGTDVVVADGGTGSSSFTANGVVISANTTTGALTSVAPATTGTFLRAAILSVPPIQWSTLVLPNSATNSQVFYATALNTLGASTKLVFDGSKLTSLDMNANRYYVNGTQGFNGTIAYMKTALVSCSADYNSGILKQIRGAGCP